MHAKIDRLENEGAHTHGNFDKEEHYGSEGTNGGRYLVNEQIYRFVIKYVMPAHVQCAVYTDTVILFLIKYK